MSDKEKLTKPHHVTVIMLYELSGGNVYRAVCSCGRCSPWDSMSEAKDWKTQHLFNDNEKGA
ncbi:MAG: hypothetical protein KAJ19_03695 [Gammaproteobacteria bacterium]|nr:hypothetical protein [Gammaproteobacteria bacterium]